MQQTAERPLPEVDRVNVLIEEMSIKNRHSKEFGVDLGLLLQQGVDDESKCVVRMSQPHLFRVGGVINHLGTQIAQELELRAVKYGNKRASTAVRQQPAAKRSRRRYEDVEPSDSESDDGAPAREDVDDYRHRKKMSSDIFRYCMLADEAKQQDMQIVICPQVQQTWQQLIAQNPNIKLDDVGDALLHALGDVLCGATKYRQLVPSSVSLHNNRTVVVAVYRDYTYWAVIHCTWNVFELEDIGFDFTTLSGRYFKAEQTVGDIQQTLLHHLETAMTDPSGGDLCRAVDVIQLVAKQSKAFLDLSGKQAGALTQSTVQALRGICDLAAGADSRVCQLTEKQGSIYVRSQPSTGRKFQVVSSTGKLTNAMLSCLSWMQENAQEFVDKRKAFMDEATKLRFFSALQSVAVSPERRLESIAVSERCAAKLTGQEFRAVDDSIKCVLAYLVLIGINKNEQRVKAVAANYRRPASKSKSTATRTNQECTSAGGMSSTVNEPTPSTSSQQP